MNALRFIVIIISLVALISLPFSAYTQSTGAISGKVSAMGSSDLSGVTVTATHDQSGQSTTTTTNSDGKYEFRNLAEGVYTLLFEREGFKKAKKRNIRVTANVTTTPSVVALEISVSLNTGDLSGIELAQVTRVAQGGAEYAGLQYLTARSQGFVNVAPFAAVGLGTGGAAVAAQVEVKVNITDYQDRDTRRRLDVSPTGPVMGPTFLVYTGTEGGGLFMGNPFRVSEAAASRQWAMMGFATLNHAADGNLTVVRQHDEVYNGQPHYVIEVKFNSSDTVRFWINKRTFLTSRVVTRYNSHVLVEEERSDYRKVSCMMLPFRIVTRLSGQRLSDLMIDSYDIQTVVPSARFTMTAGE